MNAIPLRKPANRLAQTIGSENFRSLEETKERPRRMGATQPTNVRLPSASIVLILLKMLAFDLPFKAGGCPCTKTKQRTMEMSKRGVWTFDQGEMIFFQSIMVLGNGTCQIFLPRNAFLQPHVSLSNPPIGPPKPPPRPKIILVRP